MTAWAEIVGAEHARPGARLDAVDDVVPTWVVRPGSADEVLRCLAADRVAVVASGLGRHMDCGAPPARLDARLCLDRLGRVVDHQAADMTVTVEAGCSLSALAATLASAGQWLPLDPPAIDATTVGGLIATNFSGPLVTSQGAVRDFLIGIRVVGADGALVSGGGRVVKNVAGYDLPKLHVGSFGTVGVIVEATFKVRPRPACEEALVVDCAHPAAAVETALAILDSSAVPLWVEVAGPGVLGGGTTSVTLAVGLGGLAEEIAAARACVEERVGARGLMARSWHGAESLRAELGGFTARPAAAILRAATLPTRVADVLDLAARAAGDLGTQLRYLARPARGVVYLALGDGAMLAPVVQALRPRVESSGGSLVVERAAPALKAGLDVWGEIGPALTLMRAVKAAFDPDRRLAPGRFVGGLLAMRLVAQELLDRCVHCGLCLASCPTYVELGLEADSPRGRIHLIQALEDGALAPTAEVRRHLDLCLGCRACETACPSGVEYGRLIEAARPYVESGRPWPARLVRRGLATVLASRRLRAMAALPLRLFAGRSTAGALARRLPSRLGGWFALAAAIPRAPQTPRLPEMLEPTGPLRGTAVLLTGCVASTLFPDTNRNTAALLARAGVRVLIPREQGCCGALALHLGAAEQARRLATRSVEQLGSVSADWIVSNAAGCGAHLRGLGHLLCNDPAAIALAARSRDALELLDELGLPPPTRPLTKAVAVHDPCHLAHGQGVRSQVRRLLAEVPGLRLTELAESDWCCGSAGTYNLTEPALARRLLARKLDRVVASGAQVVAAANPGCLLQMRAGAIARGLGVEIVHPIDLLAAAHGVT